MLYADGSAVSDTLRKTKITNFMFALQAYARAVGLSHSTQLSCSIICTPFAELVSKMHDR